MFSQQLSIIPPLSTLSIFSYSPPPDVGSGLWSLRDFSNCDELVSVEWVGDRAMGNHGVSLTASFKTSPISNFDVIAGCFEDVVNVFGGVTCSEFDHRWEPDFRSYYDSSVGLLTVSKVSVSQTICRENVHTFFSVFPCSTHSSLTGAYDAAGVAKAEGIRMKLHLNVKSHTVEGELEVMGMGGERAMDYLGKATIDDCPLTTSSSLSILLPAGGYLEGAKGGDYENVDGQWNKVGWGLWGLWNMGGSIYNVASLDKVEDIILHLPPLQPPPSPRWTFDKSVAQGRVDGEGEVRIKVTNGHSTCGANILITDFVNGNLMEPDYTTLRVEGESVKGVEINKSLPHIGATVTFTASFTLGFGETGTFVYYIRNHWRPISDWPPYANRGVELGRGQVEVELVGKCGVER